jgi:hypothetical protein
MIEFVQLARQYHVEHLTMAAVGAAFVVAALVDQARLRHGRRRDHGQRVAAAGVGGGIGTGTGVGRRLLGGDPPAGAPAVAHASGHAAEAGRASGAARGGLRETRLRHLAALLALVAGVIHLLVAPEHFAEGAAVGAFMVVAGAAQVAAGALLWLRPSRPLMVAALAGTLGILAVYAASRTTGLPIGPTPWVPERVGTIDLASKVTEVEFVATVGLLLALGRAPAAAAPRAAGAGPGAPRTGGR